MERKETLISVIIPVYMVEEQLDRCIKSVAAQTWKQMEIILVDDGSPDRCPQICDEWKARDDRIRVLHLAHQGLAGARNAGLAAAAGAYISFVDSDDYIHPQMMERMIHAIGESDLCICDYYRVLGTETKAMSSRGARAGTYSGDDIINHLLWQDEVFFCSACNKLYRNVLFSDLRYPSGKYYEDSFMIHRLLHTCQRVTIICDSLYYYVKRTESIMEKPYDIGRLDACEAMLDRAGFLLDQKMGQQVILITLRNYFWHYVEGFRHALFAKPVKRRIYFLRLRKLRRAYAAIYPQINKTSCRLWERMFLWGMRRMMGFLCIPGMMREALR